MDVFRQKYNVYYSVLYMTGLWPHNQSLLSKFQRTMFPLLTLCCIAIQVFTLTAVEKSLYNILMMLSYGIPMLLYFLRYVGFMLNFPIIKSLYENIVQDYNTLKNPIEAEMFMKQVQETKRVVFTLTALSGGVVLFVFATLLVPTLLRSHLQIHYLKIFGFFYNETSVQTDLVCCHLVLLYLAVMQLDEIDNVLVSLQFVLAHVIIMFSNNYSGQRLINTSIGIFQGTYNSLWYRIPPKSQKTLLFILMKSATEVRFNLSGLFTPCYEGFTSMMSSSFSYFTVLHSVQ
ncbi:uncharacterized protein LOC143259626 isoform X4 [Megalopta genalis]|uniref:uncharacterized protein LOC143259626 isoform X4 n=1 Tax=Megalopta genalis TaxID=115081 RepID=UPI003FD1CF1E